MTVCKYTIGFRVEFAKTHHTIQIRFCIFAFWYEKREKLSGQRKPIRAKVPANACGAQVVDRN